MTDTRLQERTTASSDTPSPRMSLLVLQGSPFCNIDCDYCYLPDRHVTRRMPLLVLEKVMERLCESGLIAGPFTVLWHAGEPLAVPVRYYRKAVDVIDRFPAARGQAEFMFQTNAMLIDQQWCDFIKEHSIAMGVSVDGPAFIHDAHRKTRGGEGTHAKAMAGIRRLQENDIPFGVIAVITEDSLDHAREIYEFMIGLGSTGVGFNVEEIEGVNARSTLSGDSAAARIRRFWRELYELNRRDGFPLAIREFDDARERILSPEEYRNDEHEAFSMINVDCDGNFSTFSPELLGQKADGYGDFAFGNVREDRILDAVGRENFRRARREISSGNRSCAESCYYYPFCQGASPSNKFYENGTFDSTETMHCRYVIQTPIDIVRSDVYRHGQWPQATRERADA